MSYEMPGQAADAIWLGLKAARLFTLIIAWVTAIILTLLVVWLRALSPLSETLLVLVWALPLSLLVFEFRARERRGTGS